jgi:predicted amidohydrolase YtcJ
MKKHPVRLPKHSKENYVRLRPILAMVPVVFIIFFAPAGFMLYGSPTNEANTCDHAPDVIYHSGIIVTMDPALPLAQAIAVTSDTIRAVGSDDEILSLLLPGCATRIVNLMGLTVLPGFNDSHSHWFSWREHICSVTGNTSYPPLEDIMHTLSRNGWTSISELNFGRPDYAPEHLDNALDLDARGELSVRLNGYWGTLDDTSLIEVLADSARTPGRVYSDRIRAPGVKLYVDDPFGTADILSSEETLNLVQAAHNHGWQVTAHAVNESAVEKILNAYENVLGIESNENYRHRIEHAVKVSDDQLERMQQKGIIASIQLMGPPDWPDQSTFQTYISNTNPEWCLRWNDFVESVPGGLAVTGSTDAPFNDSVCDYSPFRVIYQAVTRRGYLDREHAEWELAQRLTIENSLRLLTSSGAYATFEENIKGTLTPGKWADLVIVSENPLDVTAPEDLLTIENYLTMVGGRIEYCNDLVYPDLCASVDTFPVGPFFVRASNYLPDQTPDLAFDGNTQTNWGAGDHAPQWIEIDLLDELRIAGIDLRVEQWPAGETRHQIHVKRNDPVASYELLHEFVGHTATDQILSYSAPSDMDAYRYFRVVTVESPSWVAWKDIYLFEQDPTSVANDDSRTPNSFALRQNYPNPFNPETVIQYEVSSNAYVSLTVFDVMGRIVRILVDNQYTPPGVHSVTWDGQNTAGNVLASGIYFYRIRYREDDGTTHQFVRNMHFIR